MRNLYPFAVYSAKGLGIISILYMSKIIDPEDLGFYGYFTLIIQVLSYLTFGIQFQLINKGSSGEKNLSELISQSLTLQILIYLISMILIQICIEFKLFTLPTKFSDFGLLISILSAGLISNLNLTLVKIGRLKNSYLPLIIENISYPLGLSLWLLICRKINFEIFVCVYLISKTIPTIILYYAHSEYFKLDFIIKFNRYNEIFQSGIKLLIYNSLFTLFLVLLQIQSSFSLDPVGFGKFKIAFLISTIPSLLINGVEQILYPVFYNRLYYQSEKIEKDLQYTYSLILFTAIGAIFPLAILVNQYVIEIQLQTIYLLLLTQFAYNKCYVRKLKLVTREKELNLALIFSILSIPLLVITFIFPEINSKQIIWLAIISLFIFDLTVSKKSNIPWNLTEILLSLALIISIIAKGVFLSFPLVLGGYLIIANRKLVHSIILIR